jgi:hypothetical protein
MQQGLGGNASAVEANAAKPCVALDKDDFFPKVSSVKGGRVAAGSGADNDDFSGDGHS